DDDGGDGEGLQVIFKRGLEEGGKSRFITEPFSVADLLELAVEQELRLEALPGARFQLVDQLGTRSSRHDDALPGFNRRTMAEIDIGSVAAIEPDRMHDRRAGAAEGVDHAAHGGDGSEGSADGSGRIGKNKVA